MTSKQQGGKPARASKWHFICPSFIDERRTGMETSETMDAASHPGPANSTNQGNDKAFGAALSRYSPVFYRIAFRKLGNIEDAEDAVQDALLSAFKNMHQFRGDAQFSTWLGSIVLNSARMQLRRRINHAVVSLDEHREEGSLIWAERLEDSAPDAEETLRDKQMRENLERVVEKLPVRLRVAFRLRVFDGLTTSEAATALGVAQGTLKARFFRARLQVTALMRKAVNSPRYARRYQKRSPALNKAQR
jgi:RNA polymerase sigma-70 factor, ECF subfamily